MAIEFTKMHGLGNDYVYVDASAHSLNGADVSALARAVSDRHRGIGADGLILMRRPEPDAGADVHMEMYNADGSRGEMCGNGLRCVAKYVVDRGWLKPTGDSATIVRVQTDRGVCIAEVSPARGHVSEVRVNMGRPVLSPREIPVNVGGDRCVREALVVENQMWTLTCVSMGNPHAVLFVDDAGAVDLTHWGPRIEQHPVFPSRTNVHFATVEKMVGGARPTPNRPDEVLMRTWERGSGVTQACGSGACAVLVAGVLEQRLARRALVHLPGGDLMIEWQADTADVWMTGPAEVVFSGQWPD
jgi:diaminopimelate epimerase